MRVRNNVICTKQYLVPGLFFKIHFKELFFNLKALCQRSKLCVEYTMLNSIPLRTVDINAEPEQGTK